MRDLKYILNNFMMSRHVTSFILNFIQNYLYTIYLIFIENSSSFPFGLQIIIVKNFLNYSENLLTIYIKNSYLKKLFIQFIYLNILKVAGNLR